ncbi:methyl-accepting chemotaxis protein [Polycladidibacter stylochi]|uniref:methyl-accepting chemotaxis protein n=1 Tax=Polycladidibacter stylochi TaxID=1807766 RepID=UPI00082A01D9|nr:cache domain-containing protein [Pseudovibrio stylochi]
MFYNNLKLIQKIMIPIVFGVTFMLGLSFYYFHLLKDTLWAERLVGLQHITETANSILIKYHEQHASGLLTAAEAKQSAKEAIRNLNYDNGNGYVFATDYNGTSIISANKEHEGKNLLSLKDAYDNYFIKKHISVARAGGGRVEYHWYRPGENEPLEKITWVQGFEPWEWVIGTGSYVVDLENKLAINKLLFTALFSVGVIGISLLSLILVRSTTTPILNISKQMNSLADGKGDIEINDTERRDEIGAMTNAMKVFVENERNRRQLLEVQEGEREKTVKRGLFIEKVCAGFDAVISEQIQTLDSATISLASAATTLQATAVDSMAQSQQAASAASEASSNVDTVASAAEELAASVSEVANQVQIASEMSAKANTQTKTTNERVAKLTQSANEISQVVTLIQDIAEQTNLLALNATIEAARAGEAGKGFAVVASEVKELAHQTSNATAEIEKKIGDIQRETESSATAIVQISESITELSETSTHIASVVEQQQVASQEIAANIAQTSKITEELSGSVEILASTSAKTRQQGDHVEQAVNVQKQLAGVITAEVEQFLQSVHTNRKSESQ